ncbi:MAG TPA: hypothetical protein PK836_08340 [Syntrophales bacterium]|nr:hypothetical protein [Syntrophales bacterium]HOM06496.1 hypothetical protein [Syntrophales bacterium]HON99881.1 hypothetical protein [Syntrophales bacterium]HPC01675.1 hypothetical protein [Syntrophales bacterium]HPQ06242.1 hypothetical protein [Syntrophales bacterium]
MPKRDNGIFCVNHPETELRILNEDQPDTFHAIRLASLVYGKRLQMENKSTLFDIYACPRCGYVEIYLPPQELRLLEERVKGGKP